MYIAAMGWAFLFSSPGEVQEELLYYPPVSALAAAAELALAKSLTLKFFYVMSKALSWKLSCPCDRSGSTCFFRFFVFLL